MTVTYWATRDSVTARTDEDRAMAHAQIYKGDDLDNAKSALVDYMRNEADGLVTRYSQQPWALNRAAAIFEQFPKVEEFDFPDT